MNKIVISAVCAGAALAALAGYHSVQPEPPRLSPYEQFVAQKIDENPWQREDYEGLLAQYQSMKPHQKRTMDDLGRRLLDPRSARERRRTIANDLKVYEAAVCDANPLNC